VPYPDEYDSSELNERVTRSHPSQPDTRVMLRVYLTPPRFWMQEHPETLAGVRAEQGDPMHRETGSAGTMDCPFAAGQTRLLRVRRRPSVPRSHLTTPPGTIHP
jgi:hypothetical protein